MSSFKFVWSLDMPERAKARVWRGVKFGGYTIEDLKQGLKEGDITFLEGVGSLTSDIACEAYKRYTSQEKQS